MKKYNIATTIRDGDLEGFERFLPSENLVCCYGGQTLLHRAVEFRREEMVLRLLEKGANVNQPDLYGTTPLYSAAFIHDLNMVEILLRNGANCNMNCIRSVLEYPIIRLETHIENLDNFYKVMELLLNNPYGPSADCDSALLYTLKLNNNKYLQIGRHHFNDALEIQNKVIQMFIRVGADYSNIINWSGKIILKGKFPQVGLTLMDAKYECFVHMSTFNILLQGKWLLDKKKCLYFLF